MVVRRREKSGRPARWLGWGVALGVLCGLRAERAAGQAEVLNFTQPIPVLNTGGHSAPVRALIFAPPDGGQLLSAGLDKIVNIWNLHEAPPAIARTIRPRIWRGYAGAIEAMALSPVAEPGGRRLLAVAGFGVTTTSRGEIGLFWFPGANDRPTGDPLPPLPGGVGPNPVGHTMSVTSLAFHPRGGILASASNDTTVRLWDLQARRTVAVLDGEHTRPVNAVAYLPDGNHLVSGGADGQLLLWDVTARAVVARARPNPRRQRANDPDGDAINALAVSPDGRFVVIGRENGDLVRYDAPTLQNEQLLPKAGTGQGAVEALALSPDGRWLITSLVSFAVRQAAERPRVECDVELRAMPGGAIRTRLDRTSNLVYACAFSPDSRRLAYAGGDAQTIMIRAVEDRNAPPIELAGQGSSLWDVGFSGDGAAIGYARRRPDLADPPSEYEDFDPSGRRPKPFAPAELRRAQTTCNGWTFRPVDPYTIDVLDAQNRGHRLTLDRLLDRRWWSYSFIPPTAEHPRPLAAIGCEAGVALYRLDDGVRTRLLAGHNGPVYALAPSPDGKWLVTGSPDQTVRLWRLAGMDVLAPLGARFAPGEPGEMVVADVERASSAEAMGLEKGDRIAAFYVNGKPGTDLKALGDLPPNTAIEFLVVRNGKQVPLGTTKCDAPALTLFPARDREWILWTPHGYYETSALGDRRYLGWHRNRLNAGEPTDYFAFDRFERELRRPDALRRVWQTADRGTMLAAEFPLQVIAANPLPSVEVVAPARPAFDPLVVPGGPLTVHIRAANAEAAGRGLIRSVRILVDGGKAEEIPLTPPQAEVDRQVTLHLNPGWHKVSVLARNDRDQERTTSFDVIAQEPPPLAPPQLNGEPKKEEIRGAAQEQANKILETSNIAYNTPETIQLDDTAVVQLKLSPSFSIGELEGRIAEPGKKEGASIPFSRRVEAHLTGSAFKIAALGVELPREVKPERVCEWSWAVTPTQPGTQRLFLTIDAVVAIEGKDAAEYEQVFTKMIKVKVTLGQRAVSFVGNNWQWLWTVGLVPLGGWVLARVRRKRHGQNEEERTKAERVSQGQAASLSLEAEGIPSVRADSKSDDQKGPMPPPAPP